MRINESDLKAVIDRLNRMTDSPMEPYSGPGKANIGNYHLSCAYGGYALHRMTSTGGGIRDIFGGHSPKKELYYNIHAYISGMADASD